MVSNREKLFAAFVVVVFVACAVLRWSGQVPYGSDSDEHLLVARTMLEAGHFSVADIHATKYPPVISSLLALLYLAQLNAPYWMIVGNMLLLFATVALWAWYLRREYGIRVAGIGTLYLASNVCIWQSVHLIIADTLFLLLVSVILLLSLEVKLWTKRQFLLALLLVTASAMVRSVGIVLSVPVLVSMLVNSNWKLNASLLARMALVALAPVATLFLYMRYQSHFGPHPTGYLETFFLLDAYDASKGGVTATALVARTLRHSVGTVFDIAMTFVSPFATSRVYVKLAYCLIAFALLVSSCMKSRKQVAIILSLLVPYLAVIILWPFSGDRFALPLLPIALLGIGEGSVWLARVVPRSAVAVGLLAFLCYLAADARILWKSASFERADRARVHQEFGTLAGWCGANIPRKDAIASLDYREHSLRLHRAVLPLKYTSDTRESAAYLSHRDVRWLIVSGAVFPLRGVYGHSLVKYLSDKARLAYRNEDFEVYRINQPVL